MQFGLSEKSTLSTLNPRDIKGEIFLKNDETGPYPPFLIDEAVWHHAGEQKSDILRMSMLPQFASKELTQKVDRFMANVAKEMVRFDLVDEAKKFWIEKSMANASAGSKITVMGAWLTYLKCAGHDSKLSADLLCDLERVAPEIVAAYILMQSYFGDCNNVSNWLQRKKLTRRQALIMARNSNDLIKDITQLAARKLPNDPGMNQGAKSIFGHKEKKGASFFKSSRQLDNIIFFHREYVRRKFYLDVLENENLKTNINKILDYACFINNTYVQNNETCSSCPILDKDLFWETFFSNSTNLFGCHEKKCKINKKLAFDVFVNAQECGAISKDSEQLFSIEQKVLSDIYQEYGLLFTDLCFRCSSEWLGTYKSNHKCLPHYSSLTKVITDINICIDDLKILNNSDVAYVNSANILKKSKIEDRYIECDDSNLVGLWIWDQINILQHSINSKNISDIIINFITTSTWYYKLDIAHKFLEVIEEFKKKTERKGQRDSLINVVTAHRNDFYRVDESIRAGTLLSTDAALERRRLRELKE